MSAAFSRTRRFGEWIGERTNPLLVKEIRQSLKSRQFVASFALVLLACWLISVGGTLSNGGQTAMLLTTNGKDFFCAYFGVLSFAIFVNVPFQAFRSLISERDQYTFELLSITTMTPGQIVRGKLSSSLVQTCLFYSAIAPFVAMTILLRGVSIPIIVFLLVLSLTISAGLSVLALAVGSTCKTRGYQTALTLVTLVLLLFFWSTSLPNLFFLLREETVPFDDYEFWVRIVIYLSFYANYFFLTLQLCISSLTFESDNRSTNVRLCLMGVFWLTYAWSIVGLIFFPLHVTREFEVALATFLIAHVLIASVLICFETDRLSRRVRRQISRNQFRLLLMPLLPGCTRGLLFCYLHLVFSLLVVLLFATTHLNYIYGVFLYAVIYVSVATLINRICQTLASQYRPHLGRVLTVLACMLAALFPYIVTAFDRFEPSPIFCVTDPFATLTNLYNSHVDSPVLISILGLTAIIMVAVNIPAIRRVIVDTMQLEEGLTNHQYQVPRASDQVANGVSGSPTPENS